MTDATTSPNSREAMGATLRKHRTDKGLTQEEVADLIGKDQASVSRAEAGGGSFDIYAAIADALGVTLGVTA